MLDKGFIHTEHTAICKCGYREKLDLYGSDPAKVAKNQGWIWDPNDGWKCEACNDPVVEKAKLERCLEPFKRAGVDV